MTTHRWLAGLVALAVFVVYLTTLAPGLTWIHNSADSGDLITAAATLGVAHPSGYPTYLLLARLAQALPAGSLAYRTNLLSAICAALAAAIVAVVAARAYPGSPRCGGAGGALAGVAFGLAPLVWSQAVVTEVYALHALLMAGLLASALPAGRAMAARHHLAAGLLFGLALGNHLTTALLLPAWLAATGWTAGRLQLRPVVLRLGGLAAGLLIYLYLPLRAAAHPPVNWGNASTPAGFWWVISGAPYQALAFGLPQGYLLERLQAWASLLTTQFGWAGLLAALYGLFFGRAAGGVKAVTGWVAAVYSIFAIGYLASDSDAYLIPVILAGAVWLGLGVATALETLARRPAARVALVGLAAAALLWNAAAAFPGVDASRETQAEAFGRAVLDTAPPAALLLTHGDRDTFTLWYFHFALGQRPDLAVVVEPLLEFDWYRAGLPITYSTLTMPAQPGESWRDALIAANPGRPACTTDPEGTEPLVCPAAP